MTHIIAEKEKKSSAYKDGRLDALSDEKVVKIKKYAKEYIAKLVHKLKKKRKSSSDLVTSPSTSTPAHAGLEDAQENSHLPEISVEDVMDMDHDDADDAMDQDDDDEDDGSGHLHSPEEIPTPHQEAGHFTLRTKSKYAVDPRIRQNLGFDISPNTPDDSPPRS